MCGVAGILRFDRSVARSSLDSMIKALAHRGPDGQGAVILNDGLVGLGHTRLAILDLTDAARQPMSTQDGAYTIVYNGEVYNFRSIRDDLVAQGQSFTSDSDTEVVLKAFAKWGSRAFARFNGMFAGAIWDSERKQLTLFRDRVGVKPLYYFRSGDLIAFASELKALLSLPEIPRVVRTDAVADYLRFGFIPTPSSPLQNVWKVQPGTIFQIDAQGRTEETTYWSLPMRGSDSYAVDSRVLFERLEELLASSFQYRMVSDVPVGIFLSGGVDSSLLASILAKTHSVSAFTMAFEDPDYDESFWARKVASSLGIDYHEYICTPSDVRAVLQDLPTIFDEPFADSSSLPTCLLARFSSKHVKVALSADGGDELFGGYKHYLRALWITRVEAMMGGRWAMKGIGRGIGLLSRKRGAIAFAGSLSGVSALPDKLRKLSSLMCADSAQARHLAAVTYWRDSDIEELTGLKPLADLAFDVDEKDDYLNRMLRLDFRLGLLDDMLVKVDRACMSVGLENREPLLDHRIVELAFSLSGQVKCDGYVGKLPLKKLLSKYFPPSLVYRPKKGFVIPLQKWLRGDLNGLYASCLSPERLAKSGLLDPKIVARHLRDYQKTNSVASNKLWALLMLQLWWEKWIAA